MEVGTTPIFKLNKATFSFSPLQPPFVTSDIGADTDCAHHSSGDDTDDAQHPLIQDQRASAAPLMNCDDSSAPAYAGAFEPQSLQINLGELLLVGGSVGAGKSTLLAGVAGLLPPLPVSHLPRHDTPVQPLDTTLHRSSSPSPSRGVGRLMH